MVKITKENFVEMYEKKMIVDHNIDGFNSRKEVVSSHLLEIGKVFISKENFEKIAIEYLTDKIENFKLGFFRDLFDVHEGKISGNRLDSLLNNFGLSKRDTTYDIILNTSTRDGFIVFKSSGTVEEDIKTINHVSGDDFLGELLRKIYNTDKLYIRNDKNIGIGFRINSVMIGDDEYVFVKFRRFIPCEVIDASYKSLKESEK